jgi:hypothetical protein
VSFTDKIDNLARKPQRGDFTGCAPTLPPGGKYATPMISSY